VLPKLNFPEYTFRLRKTAKGSLQIFDPVRKKFTDLNPEEWVRQHMIRFLIEERDYPLSLFTVEKGLKLNSTAKRTDIVVYDNLKQPLLLVECKAPEIPLDTKTVEQGLRYNLTHQAAFVVLSNGLRHLTLDQTGTPLPDIPPYPKNHHKTG
jgi:type I site-specific restriction endonuclease